MRQDLMEILACPICKGVLGLSIVHEEDGDVVEGQLNCMACGVSYPITSSIPNLVSPQQKS